MPRRTKNSLQRARGVWLDLSTAKKTIISLGAVGAALVAISGAFGLGSKLVDDHRPWASRQVEMVVAGLQLESQQRYLRDLDDRIFQIRLELSRNPTSRFLQDELKRRQEERERLRQQIERQIQGR